MKRHQFVTGTITYAIKGRDLLRRHGIRADMEKTKSTLQNGCGYSIVADGDFEEIKEILKNGGIKILSSSNKNAQG